ncbi:MAG: class I SAM-dependent methyltransferase [Bacteroidales bacterium]|nr:class I SAM-dependent methyltransferase [Bacteroidales bacterium]
MKKCLVCNSPDTSMFLECTDHFVSGEKFIVNRCKTCGFRFTANAPDEMSIAGYYHSENYISHSNTQKGIVNSLYHQVRKFMLGQKCKMIKHFTPGKKILDIGCGTGHFLNYMQHKGFQVSGVEIEPSARKFAMENFNLAVRSPRETLNEKHTGEFDVVTLWHVLEHIYDIKGYLEWIFDSLKPNGFLFVALPNFDSYDAQKYAKYWAAYDVPRHLWHFNPLTFEKLINQYEFQTIRVKPLVFDAYYNCMMSARYAGKKLSFLQGLFTGQISNFHSLFNPEKSSSVVYVVKKPGPKQ